MQTGKIGVTTENIFPIIKKFLYSDHEIFLRELVSNAVDATQKLKTLANMGDFKGELGDITIRIKLDKKAKTLTISDQGIGMTAEEVDKYINQIAFSSAEDFLEKYKNQAASIIGHFGLGFYSSFMVSEQVEVISKSYKEGLKAVKWECDGTPDYKLEDTERVQRGTDIILHIDKDSEEFLEESRIEGILRKYCKFLPVPIAFGKKTEWKDGKSVELDEDKIINNTTPLWTKKPADVKEEDYKEFYRELYPMAEEPLFNIHLNVDYPFNLTGILYFPKIKSNFDIQKNKIQLYSNQVFVTDSVEGIVPEFLTLLHGVLDSPDIPLNVSRSYLQSDSNVKKISGHITKKVADRLQDIFKNDREQFEKKWDDLKLFIEYGMISEEKFYDQASKFALLKNTENKYFTFEEYEKLIKENQKDKNKTLVYLYTTDTQSQFSFIETARNKGYDVLVMDGHLDMHFINQLETKFKESHFVRVDSDIIENIIQKDEKRESKLTAEQQNELRPVFNSLLPEGKSHFSVAFESLSENDSPVLITQMEFMRRMKDMSQIGGGPMSFYGEMPDQYNVVINSNHPLVLRIQEEMEKKCRKDLEKISEKLKPLADNKAELDKANKDKKDEEIAQADKDRIAELDKKITEFEDKKQGVLKKFGQENKIVKQLIDIALLSNNMLKGEDLNKFVKRSIELL
ncbi:MAG TPA: molecular chaperone HtpG [Bacteroidales bacterium]|nr:molecular chaperone HtpG [Bacteroidales bacterium]